MSWIRTDVDFGVPYANYVIAARNPLIRELIGNLEDPTELEAAIKALVERVRPSLKGLAVVQMSSRGSMRLTFCVTHPSLPRIKNGGLPPEVHLEPCAVCDSDMEVNQMVFWGGWHNGVSGRDVCSQACADKWNALDEPGEDAAPTIVESRAEWSRK